MIGSQILDSTQIRRTITAEPSRSTMRVKRSLERAITDSPFPALALSSPLPSPLNSLKCPYIQRHTTPSARPISLRPAAEVSGLGQHTIVLKLELAIFHPNARAASTACGRVTSWSPTS